MVLRFAFVVLVATLVGVGHGAVEDDDDEFVRSVPVQRAAGGGGGGPAKPAAGERSGETSGRQPGPPGERTLWEQWGWEAAFLLFAGVFLTGFFWGEQNNKTRAVRWFLAIRPVLEKNFSRIDTLVRVSSSCFRLYVTGRQNCYAAELRLNLLPRQDVTALTMGLFTSNVESFIVEVPMTEKMHPFVLALIPERKEKKVREEMVDLAMTKARKSPISGFVMLCDSSEVALPADVIAALEQCSDLFGLIYCSDCFSLFETDFKQMARFVINLPRKSADLDRIQSALAVCFRLVDVFASVHLSSNGVAKAKNIRKKAQADKAKERQAELDAKAEEKKLAKLAEEREKLSRLTGKDLAKAEEKIRKREAKMRDKKRKGKAIVVK